MSNPEPEILSVTLELYEYSTAKSLVVFDSIETGLRLTMSRELFESQGEPTTVTVLIPSDQLSDAAKLSNDVERL